MGLHRSGAPRLSALSLGQQQALLHREHPASKASIRSRLLLRYRGLSVRPPGHPVVGSGVDGPGRPRRGVTLIPSLLGRSARPPRVGKGQKET